MDAAALTRSTRTLGVHNEAAGDRGSGGNTKLPPARRPRKGLDETAEAARRLARSVGKRVGEDADPEDLALIVALQQAVTEAWRLAVDGLRDQGHSDMEIARVLGTTRQAVSQRWPRANPGGMR